MDRANEFVRLWRMKRGAFASQRAAVRSSGTVISSEKVLRFLEEAPGLRVYVRVAQVREFLQLGALGCVQMCRDLDNYAHVQIACAVALNIFDAFALEPEYGAGLRSRGNLDVGLAGHRRHLDLRA